VRPKGVEPDGAEGLIGALVITVVMLSLVVMLFAIF
jgi:hypothetical protein